MICPLCDLVHYSWVGMRMHIKDKHPEETRPDKLFTREARERNP
jgi:hypothetical protein